MVDFSPFGGSTNPAAGAAGAAGNGPLQGLIGAAGLGISLFGTSQGISAASQESTAQGNLGEEESTALNINKQQMGLDFQRQQRGLIRRSLQTSAQSKAASVASGSQFGSGEAGGQGQISGEANTAGVNNSQNYTLGLEQNANAQAEITSATQIGQANSSMSKASGISSIGSSLMGSAGQLSQLGGYLGSFLGAAAL